MHYKLSGENSILLCECEGEVLEDLAPLPSNSQDTFCKIEGLSLSGCPYIYIYIHLVTLGATTFSRFTAGLGAAPLSQPRNPLHSQHRHLGPSALGLEEQRPELTKHLVRK